MADINKTVALRFENGGTLSIVTDPGGVPVTEEVFNILAGSLQWTPGFREPIPQNDRGIHGDVVPGDDRDTAVQFTIRVTGDTFETLNLYERIKPIYAGGIIVKFALVFTLPDSRGAATGKKVTFGACYMADSGAYQAQPGAAFDQYVVQLVDAEPEPLIEDLP